MSLPSTFKIILLPLISCDRSRWMRHIMLDKTFRLQINIIHYDEFQNIGRYHFIHSTLFVPSVSQPPASSQKDRAVIYVMPNSII